MRILIFTFPFRGHSMQAIEIANYLSLKGHTVLVDSHPNYFDYLSSKIIKRATLYNFYTFQQELSKDTLLNCAEGILETCQKYINDYSKMTDKPDIIIFDSMAYWGHFIAKEENIPSISLLTIQPFTHQNFLDNAYFYLKTYSKFFKNERSFLRNLYIFQEISKTKYSLPNDFFYEDLICAKGTTNLVLLPKSICKFRKDLDSSYKLYSPIIDYKRSVVKKEKSVYIATGSIINDIDFLKNCINSLLSLNIKIYISAGKSNTTLKEIYNKNSNIIIYDFAPQMELLNKCSVFITHAGSNSICEAIYCETPMIAIPLTNDEYLNAEMIEKIGIGINIKNSKSDIYNIKNQVKQILDNKNFSKRIKKINKEINSKKAFVFIDKIIEKYKNKK